MPQRLHERPLLVDPFVQSRLGQLLGPSQGLRPEQFDGVPHRAEVVGRADLAQLHAFGVPAVEFRLDVCGDVDAVDDKVLHVAGDLDANQPGVDDLHAR